MDRIYIPQPQNTVRFISGGTIRKTARVMAHETHVDACRRVGINVGARQCPDGSVRLAEWNGYTGEVRYA